MPTGPAPGINQVPSVPLSRAGCDSGLSGGSLKRYGGGEGPACKGWSRAGGGGWVEAWQEPGWAFACSRRLGSRRLVRALEIGVRLCPSHP